MKNKRFSKRKAWIAAVFAFAFFQILFFQNCALRSEYEINQSKESQSASESTDSGQAQSPPIAQPPVLQPPTSTPPSMVPADTVAPIISNLISNQVANGDSTTSTNITFSFTITDNGSGVQTRECRISLNGIANSYSQCATSSSHGFTNLAAGRYIFRVRATDNSGNQSFADYSFTINSSTGGESPPPISGGGTVPTPVEAATLGTRWLFIGDSQTSGRSNVSYLNRLQSPVRSLIAIYGGVHGITATSRKEGNGGQTLLFHKDSIYNNTSKVADPSIYTWIHFQESGSQGTGQETAYNYAVTLRAFLEDIIRKSPNAVISTETAFSFGDFRARQAGRNWGFCTTAMSTAQCTELLDYNRCLPDSTGLPPSTCQNYNLAQKAVIEHYRNIRRIRVFGADVDDTILRAEKIFAPHEVWYQPYNAENYVAWYPYERNNPDISGINYHYTYLGNLIVSLAVYKALGYNAKALTTAQIQTLFNDPAIPGNVSCKDPTVSVSSCTLTNAEIEKILSLF